MLMDVFIFEVVTRLLLAPNRKKFFHHPLNIIDMVSVIPIYITLTFDLAVGSESELGDLGRLIQVQVPGFLLQNLLEMFANEEWDHSPFSSGSVV